MKKILSVIAIASILLTSCGETVQPSSTDNASEEKALINANASVDLKIDGMVCEKNCAGKIKEEVRAMEGVKDCDIDFETKTCTVNFDDTKTSQATIQDKIEGINDGVYQVVKEKTEATEEALDNSTEETIDSEEKENSLSMNAGTLVKVRNIVGILSSLL